MEKEKSQQIISIGINNIGCDQSNANFITIGYDPNKESEYDPNKESEYEEEATVVENSDSCHDYPPLSVVHCQFFAEEYFPPVEQNKTREKRPVPVEKILHAIYDYTKEWSPDISITPAVHKWKVMYEALKRMNYRKEMERESYTPFVKSVVAYCFPDVSSKYANNISKSILPDNYKEWDPDDKALFSSIKKALTFEA